jgi:PadR family transcriptional regulator PadR
MPAPVRLTLSTTLVLGALAQGVRHGFDLLEETGLESGTVYPILRRLERAGLLRSRWEAVQRARSEGRPPRRYYELTGAGAKALEEAIRLHPEAARSRIAVPRPRLA